jgi:hypothetical protein
MMQGRPDLAKRLGHLLSEVDGKRKLIQNRPHEVSMWSRTMQTEMAKIFHELRPAATEEDMTRELVGFGTTQPLSTTTKKLSDKDIFRQ